MRIGSCVGKKTTRRDGSFHETMGNFSLALLEAPAGAKGQADMVRQTSGAGAGAGACLHFG